MELIVCVYFLIVLYETNLSGLELARQSSNKGPLVACRAFEEVQPHTFAGLDGFERPSFPAKGVEQGDAAEVWGYTLDKPTEAVLSAYDPTILYKV